MHHAADILLTLFLIFLAAQVGAEIAQRLKLPGVVGEIAAGCVVGPSALGWLTPEQILPGTPLDVLAEVGVVLLLFSVGLETRLDDLKKVGKSAFLVGVLGVILPFGLGALWAHGEGFDWIKSLFVAAAFVATSAGITARVLQELGVLSRVESRVILGAAVIDDIPPCCCSAWCPRCRAAANSTCSRCCSPWPARSASWRSSAGAAPR
jgi:Kef-type K+ transport system membrane component KefB